MRRRYAFHAILLVALCSSLALVTVACPPTDRPDFVGTWKGLNGSTELTMTFTKSTFSAFSDEGSGNTAQTEGTVTSYDESAGHIKLTVTSNHDTGSPSEPSLPPGTVIYCLYTVSDDTLVMSISDSDFPTDLVDALTFTKQ